MNSQMYCVNVENYKFSCQRVGCNSSVFVDKYSGQFDKFRCPECLGLPCTYYGIVPADNYTVCSNCRCYYKCTENYLGSNSKCPGCRNPVSLSNDLIDYPLVVAEQKRPKTRDGGIRRTPVQGVSSDHGNV